MDASTFVTIPSKTSSVVNDSAAEAKVCKKEEKIGNICTLPNMDEKITSNSVKMLENDLKELFKSWGIKCGDGRMSESFLSLDEISHIYKELLNTNQFIEILELLKFKAGDTSVLLFCKALMLTIMSQFRIGLIEAQYIECLASEFIKAVNLTEKRFEIQLNSLPSPLKEKCTPLCEKIMGSTDVFEVTEINVNYLCLKTLQSLSFRVREWKDVGFMNSSTIIQVLEKFHSFITTPAFNISYKLAPMADAYDLQIATIYLCLQYFEAVLFQNPEKQEPVLYYRENLLLKCMCRYLSFCLKALFIKDTNDVKDVDAIDFEKKTSVVSKYVHLHQSCLIATLKVLLIIHPNYDSNISDITSSLMEKLFICFLETCYSTLECKFELCLMTLELMVNSTEFSFIDRKQFAKMCLMKFIVGKDAYVAVEVLIKILNYCLKRVIMLGSLNANAADAPTAASANDSFNAVFHVAEEHMEHSFVCSYICVFLSYFCDIKESFFSYVCDRIPVDMAETAIIVMGKFKEFIPLMGKRNGHAFSMLDRARHIFLAMAKRE